MLLMSAVADNCKKVVDVVFKDDYTNQIASVAATTTINVTKDVKDMFAEIIADVIGKNKISANMSVEEKIVILGRTVIEQMTNECNLVLGKITSDLGLSSVDKISTEDAEILTLWLIISETLSSVPSCRVLVKNANSYKKPKENQTVTGGSIKNDPKMDNPKTSNILDAIRAGYGSYLELTENERKIVDEITEIIQTDGREAAMSIKNGKSIKDRVVLKKAKTLAHSISGIIPEKSYNEFLIRNHIKCGGSTAKNVVAASVLYDGIVYDIHEVIKVIDNPNDFIVDILRIPEVYPILAESDPKKINFGELKDKGGEKLMRVFIKHKRGSFNNFAMKLANQTNEFRKDLFGTGKVPTSLTLM